MSIRRATLAVASILAAYGCGSSSPAAPTTPSATLPNPPPGSSAATVSSQAQLASVEVSLVSVSPGTPSGDRDWCVGAEDVTLTAHVVGTSETEVTEGTIVWQTCTTPQLGGAPREACDRKGGARWSDQTLSELSYDATPSITTGFTVPVIGFRLVYRPRAGAGVKRTTGQSFNLDRTCP